MLERLEARRLLAAGDLDLSFGDNGAALVTGAASFEDAVAVLPGDKIAVLTPGSGSNPIGVDRYTADGKLDPTFGGGDGHVEFQLQPPKSGSFSSPFEIFGLPGGKILLFAAVETSVPNPLPGEPPQ